VFARPPFRRARWEPLPPLVANADVAGPELDGDPTALAELRAAWAPWLDTEGR